MAPPRAGHTPAPLAPSDLGTREYWDGLYASELRNHAADASDTGTVWFDDADAEARIVDFLADAIPAAPTAPTLSHASSAPSPTSRPSRADAALLDLGCGNGALLRALRAAGWAGRARGVDYSPQSIALARQIDAADADAAADSAAIADSAAAAAAAPPVELAVWDVLAGPLAAVLDGAQARGWDVVLDKGTFDAVSLSQPSAAARSDGDADAGLPPCEAYAARALRLVRRGGLFVVTSCNWTEDELVRWFAPPPDDHPASSASAAANATFAASSASDDASSSSASDDDAANARFEPAGSVRYRSFTFGGRAGQPVSTVCFRKRAGRSQDPARLPS